MGKKNEQIHFTPKTTTTTTTLSHDYDDDDADENMGRLLVKRITRFVGSCKIQNQGYLICKCKGNEWKMMAFFLLLLYFLSFFFHWIFYIIRSLYAHPPPYDGWKIYYYYTHISNDRFSLFAYSFGSSFFFRFFYVIDVRILEQPMSFLFLFSTTLAQYWMLNRITIVTQKPKKKQFAILPFFFPN